jgi:tetratricopeptide (TPR) repeat protein
MDDKLFYVESPDGNVLGPMNMIHILEGIAAGKVLETARICEVGQQFWISLDDVTYTRDDAVAGPATPHAPTPEPPSEQPVADASGTFGDEWQMPETPQQLETMFDGSPLGGAPDDADLFSPSESDPLETSAFEDEDLEALEASATYETWIPGERRTESDPTSTPPPTVADEAYEIEPAEARASSAEMALPSAMPMMPSAGPASAPDDFEPLSSFAEESVPDGAGDFALQMIEGEDVSDEGAPARRRWVLPTAVALGIPVIVGLYVMVGGKVPFVSSGGSFTPAPTPTVVSEAPESDSTRLGTANRLLAAGSTTDAKKAFEGIVTEDPSNASAHAGLARVAVASGDRDAALKQWARAIELDPKSVGLWIERGQAQLQWGQPAEAAAAAQKALEIDRTASAAVLLLARAQAARGDKEGAAQELAKYVKSAPDDVDARRELAMALAAVGRTEPAIAEMDAFLAKRPDDRDAQYARVDWMVSLGKLSEAGKIYGKLAAEKPKNAYYQYLAGLAHPKTEEGVEYLQKSVKLSSTNGDAYAKLGEYLAALGRRADAITALEKASSLRSSGGDEKTLLVKLQRAQAVAQEASAAKIEEKKLAAETAPTPSSDSGGTLEARIQRIRESLAGENYDGARATVARGQKDLASSEEAMRNLAFWLAVCDAEQGDSDAAIAKLEKLDADASYEASGLQKGAVRTWLARIYIVKGDVRSAVAVLDQVGPDDPNEYAIARLWEGIALASLGMEDLAKRTWTRVSSDVGASVRGEGRAAVKSAEFLVGSLSKKDFQTAVSPVPGFENDMHYLLAYSAFRNQDPETARLEFRQAVQTSRGREFPYHLAEAEMSGAGLTTP